MGMDLLYYFDTSYLHQISSVKRVIGSGKDANSGGTTTANQMRRELLRLPNPHETDRYNTYSARNNDDYIQSESDRQLLLIK